MATVDPDAARKFLELELDAQSTAPCALELVPDIGMAQRFFDLLAPGDLITFQTFSDRKKSGERDLLAWAKHGTLSELAAELQARNQQGAGVFFMVNPGDGKKRPGARSCRTEENVIGTRAMFVDLDGSPLEPVLAATPRPSIVVESSPGRWHAYWRARDFPLDRFRAMQSGLAVRFNGDRSVIDPARVMRVPGFFHQKKTPFKTRILELMNVAEVGHG